MNQVVPRKRPKEPTRFERFCNLHETNVLMPFVVCALNAMGLGVVDRLMSKRAADFTFKRMEALLYEVESRIDKKLAEPRSDNFFPALNQVVQDILQTPSEEKLKRFATVLVGTWNDQASKWDEVAQTLRLIRHFEDAHILILRAAQDLKNSESDGSGLKTFRIGKKGYPQSVDIGTLMPAMDTMLMTSCASDLVAHGLLNDSFEISGSTFAGVRSGPTESPKAFSITPLGTWLLSHLSQ